MSRLALFFALTLLFISPFASADIPHLISLQGKLTDASDNPISSSTNFVFRIYDVPTGGSALWTEFQTIAPDTLGIFSALLGSATALNIPFNTSYWLEVKVNSEILSPRTRMGSAGYALRSESPWNATGNNIYATNAGNVGVGTSAPGARLNVIGNVLFGGANAGTVGSVQITTGGGSPISNRLTYGTDGSGWKFAIGKNQGGAITEQLTMQDNGNVGIGTASPGYKLDVIGDIRATGRVLWGDAASRTEYKDDAGAIASKSGFFQTASPVNYYAGASSWQHLIESRHSNDANNYALQIAGSFFDQDLYFRKTNNNPATGWNKFVYQNSAGNVGIGTTGPGSKLHVLGGRTQIGSISQNYMPSGASWNYNLLLDSQDTTSIGFHDSGASVSSIRYDNSGFTLGADDGWGVKRVSFPGGVQIADGTQGAGKVLTSDANGLASWQTASSGITKRTLPAPSYNQWTDEPNVRDASATTSGYYSRGYCGQSFGPESYTIKYELGSTPRPVFISLTGEVSASSFLGGSNAFSAGLTVSVSNDDVTYTALPSTYTTTEWYTSGIPKKQSVGIPASSAGTWARYIKVTGTFSKNCCENACQTVTARVYDLSVYY